jgi:RNA polymerase sigma-70 factor (ECF subfamily)
MEGQLVVKGERADSDASLAYTGAARANVANAYRLAGYLLGDAVEAQDAVQEALIKAWRNWASLRDPASFAPWFDRIVLNVCRDRMRLHKHVRMIELDAADEVEAADGFHQLFARDEVAAAVARLAPDQRIVVALRFWRDLSLDQVAEVLGIPVGTVKSRLYYALRNLRTELDRSVSEG